MLFKGTRSKKHASFVGAQFNVAFRKVLRVLVSRNNLAFKEQSVDVHRIFTFFVSRKQYP